MRRTSLCAATFFFFFLRATKTDAPRLSRCPVLFLCSYNEAKCRRAYRDALCRMYFYQRKCVVVRARIPGRGCLEKAMLEKRARCTFIYPLRRAVPVSRRRSRIHGESIMRKSIASRWWQLHRYLANEISRNSDVCASDASIGTHRRNGSLNWHNYTMALMLPCLWFRGKHREIVYTSS